MTGDVVPPAPASPTRARSSAHQVRHSVLLTAAALVILAWSASLEVACAAAGGAPDGSFVMTPPCPAQSHRVAAAVLAAGVVVVGLGLFLVARRRTWARRHRAGRWLSAGLAMTAVAAVVSALFSTGFVASI
jgi:hypothetical protein